MATRKATATPDLPENTTVEAAPGVIERLALKKCGCGAPSKTGECEHPAIEGEDVIDMTLVDGVPVVHGSTQGYWRFKRVPDGGEGEIPQMGLEQVIARYQDGLVRVWSPKHPGRISLVPVTNIKMLRLVVAK